MINDMKDHGFKECVIASTGNAAISLSAMAACESIKVNVFVSKDISPERLNLITLFEPKLHLVNGTYDDAMLESENYAKQNKLYSANPGHNKNKMLGDSNAGKEIVSQLKPNSPDYLIVPKDNGTLISGIWMGAKMSGANPAVIAAVAERQNSEWEASQATIGSRLKSSTRHYLRAVDTQSTLPMQKLRRLPEIYEWKESSANQPRPPHSQPSER